MWKCKHNKINVAGDYCWVITQMRKQSR